MASSFTSLHIPNWPSWLLGFFRSYLIGASFFLPVCLHIPEQMCILTVLFPSSPSSLISILLHGNPLCGHAHTVPQTKFLDGYLCFLTLLAHSNFSFIDNPYFDWNFIVILGSFILISVSAICLVEVKILPISLSL